MGTFSFKERDDTAYTDTFLKELQEAVDSLTQTILTTEELEYMTRHCRFLPRVYSMLKTASRRLAISAYCLFLL